MQVALRQALATASINPVLPSQLIGREGRSNNHYTACRVVLPIRMGVALFSAQSPAMARHPLLSLEPSVAPFFLSSVARAAHQPDSPFCDFTYNPSPTPNPSGPTKPPGGRITTVTKYPRGGNNIQSHILGPMYAFDREHADYLLKSVVIYTTGEFHTPESLEWEHELNHAIQAMQVRLELFEQMTEFEPYYESIATQLMHTSKKMLNPFTINLAANTALWAGRTYLFKGSTEKAGEAFDRALRIYMKTGNLVGQAITKKQLDVIHEGRQELLGWCV